jgi:hypothetical protein
MKLIIVFHILSVVSTIYCTNQVMPAAAQILRIPSQIPKEKDLSIEMRIQFVMFVHAFMIKYNNLIKKVNLEALKKQEEEKKRTYEEKLKEFLKKMVSQTKKPKAVLTFLRF